jgi:hypothetical protein
MRTMARRMRWGVSRRGAIRVMLGASAAALVRPAGATTPPSGAVEGSVEVRVDDRPRREHSGVVVYLEDVPGPPPIPPSSPHTILQRNKAFVPKVSAVVKGSTIAFPNDDKIFHNVFSMSRALKFDLGLYRSGSTKSVVASRVGIVDVYCNIHPEMAAKVLVLANQFFAVTDEAGHFKIEGVPPGTYTIVAWVAKGEPWRGEVTIAAGEATRLSITAREERGGDSHLRKDGTPYGRYK